MALTTGKRIVLKTPLQWWQNSALTVGGGTIQVGSTVTILQISGGAVKVSVMKPPRQK